MADASIVMVLAALAMALLLVIAARLFNRLVAALDVRYVLSPSLMERLTALAARFRGLRALFADGRLLLLLPTYRNRFEPSLLERADSEAQIDTFITDLRACLGVAEALDLNTRIWSKS